MQNKSRKVKTFSAKVCKSERKMEQPLFRFPKMLIDIKDKMVHVVRRLVAVVEEMERAFFRAVEIFIKARKLPLVLKAELDESRHILNVVHAFAVCAFSDHREATTCNLAEKIVDVSTVLLAENHCRAD